MAYRGWIFCISQSASLSRSPSISGKGLCLWLSTSFDRQVQFIHYFTQLSVHVRRRRSRVKNTHIQHYTQTHGQEELGKHTLSPAVLIKLNWIRFFFNVVESLYFECTNSADIVSGLRLSFWFLFWALLFRSSLPSVSLSVFRCLCVVFGVRLLVSGFSVCLSL